MHHPQQPTGTAYSYLRFSSKRQEQGDSLRRQTEARDRWLARHPGVKLDESLTLADLGVSAFRGKHRAAAKTALAQFLRAVEGGRVKAGSYLIVESLDRLTREELGDAFELVLGLVNRGIRIVQLSPVESILEKPVNMTALMLAVVELSRGRGESQRKSEMIGPAWARKRERCRADKKPITLVRKAWLDVADGKFVFKPGAKALIKRIFALTAAGYGCRAVAQALNREKVPTWVDGSPWHDVFIRRIVRGREVLGEFQPHVYLPGGGRKPEGDPIPGYYPAAVSEAEWHAADAARKSRDGRGGRPTREARHLNVFHGLLRDARSGEPLNIVRKGSRRVLARSGFHRLGASGVTFPLDVFERAVLTQLAELDPRDVLGTEDEPNDVAELTAKLARLDAQLEAMADEYDGEEIPQIAAKAASPLSAAWGDCRGLVETLETAPREKARDLRVRLRAALARIVESVTCLFVDGGLTRLAAVRVQFAGEQHRDYLITYNHAHKPSKRPASLSVKSFAGAGAKDGFDLRKPKDAAALEKELVAAMKKDKRAAPAE
jgi:DNA invertase Pin-like site-specific DNA recombinase